MMPGVSRRLSISLSGLTKTPSTSPCDVTDRKATDAFVAGTLESFGTVDGLVCNAGRSLMATLDETSDEQFREEFDLKIFGVLNIVRSARAALAASPHGSVVNVNAILSRQPELRLAATSAARAGLLNLSHSLSEDPATDGIRVNSVLLGLVDTGQWRRRFEQSGSGLEALAADAGKDEHLYQHDLGVARIRRVYEADAEEQVSILRGEGLQTDESMLLTVFLRHDQSQHRDRFNPGYMNCIPASHSAVGFSATSANPSSV